MGLAGKSSRVVSLYNERLMIFPIAHHNQRSMWQSSSVHSFFHVRQPKQASCYLKLPLLSTPLCTSRSFSLPSLSKCRMTPQLRFCSLSPNSGTGRTPPVFFLTDTASPQLVGCRCIRYMITWHIMLCIYMCHPRCCAHASSTTKKKKSQKVWYH